MANMTVGKVVNLTTTKHNPLIPDKLPKKESKMIIMNNYKPIQLSNTFIYDVTGVMSVSENSQDGYDIQLAYNKEKPVIQCNKKDGKELLKILKNFYKDREISSDCGSAYCPKSELPISQRSCSTCELR